MPASSGPSPVAAAVLHATLLEFFQAPGKYQLGLRQPELLFASVREVLQIAAGRWPSSDVPPLQATDLQRAAKFFVRTALLQPGADHYTLLGVRPPLDAVELKERYRLLMRLIHPDFAAAGASGWPADAATRVNRAYEVLSSPALRQQYEQQLAAHRAQPLAGAPRPDWRLAPRRLEPQPAARHRKAAWAAGMSGSVGALIAVALLASPDPVHLVQRERMTAIRTGGGPPAMPEAADPARLRASQVLAQAPRAAPDPATRALPATPQPVTPAASPGRAPQAPAPIPTATPLPAANQEPAGWLPPAPSVSGPPASPPASPVTETGSARASLTTAAPPTVPAALGPAPQRRPPSAPPAERVATTVESARPFPHQGVAPPAAPGRRQPPTVAGLPALADREAPGGTAPAGGASPVATTGAALVAAPAPSPTPPAAVPPPVPVAASPAFSQQHPAPLAVTAQPLAAVAAAIPTATRPMAARVPAMIDVQPMLSQLLLVMESGSGEQLLRLLDRDARNAPSAQALSRQYERLVQGPRPVRLSHVEFAGEPGDGSLLVRGRMRVHLGETTIGSRGEALALRAEFTSLDGRVVLKALAAEPE